MPIETYIDHTYGVLPVKKDGEIWMFLLIKSRRGHWGFPKGHSHHNETALETARRELKEEAGVTNAIIHQDVSFSESHAVEEDVRVVTKIVTWFLGIVDHDAKLHPQDFEEIIEVKWYTFEDALATISHETTKQTLLDLQDYLLKNNQKVSL